MKKMILCAAALLFGVVVYGQDIVGSPTSALVPALPGAAIGANTGESIQNGNDNKVRVRQAGTSQSVYTNQNDGSGTGGNLAKVVQMGAVQATSGVENATDILQSGSANQAQTRQEGDYNNAVTRQGQNNDASARNKAKIRQGTGNQAQDNRAAIDQDGDDNWAQTQQTYDNSDAWTRQIGTANKSMIVQDAGPNQTDGHEANSYQSGNRNESAISQSGAGARNLAVLNQIGDDNQAKQMQTTTAASGATGNRAGISQTFFGPITHAKNRARGDIFSELDSAAGSAYHSSLSSFGARAKQTQNGEENEADILQSGGLGIGDSNYAEQEQASGASNIAGIEQDWKGTSGENYAKQYQAGNDNRSALMQNGTGMKALQDQRGNSSDALSYQLGENHLLNIHQRGDDNVAHSTQHGSANAALMVQDGGHTYSVQQNMGLSHSDFSAGGNQADILQLGPNGDFATDGIDCDFDNPMDLNMDYSIPDFDLGDVCPDC
tara:strand:+ start:7885 stop:9360 length:1476 start_codon:yes stop_codon:yes gene_type:complete